MIAFRVRLPGENVPCYGLRLVSELKDDRKKWLDCCAREAELFVLLALAPARRSGFGGSLFQFPALPLGRNAFSGGLFPMALRMNAEIAP